jgi:hypothetical protein
MKRIILPLFVLAYASCTKPVDVQLDPNKAYTIKYKNDDQVVKTRVSHDTLRLDFYQKVNFLLDPKEYAHSWALDLIQDFSHSYMKDLHFDAVATAGGYAHDWVPINLNDVAPEQKTTSTVSFEGKQYTQVSLTRVFEFYSVLGSNQAAVNYQNALLQTNTDFVIYKAFYSYNNIYSLSNDGNFKIVYTK